MEGKLEWEGIPAKLSVMELSEMLGIAARELHCRTLISKEAEGARGRRSCEPWCFLGGHAGMTFAGLPTNRDPSPGQTNLPTHLQVQT